MKKFYYLLNRLSLYFLSLFGLVSCQINEAKIPSPLKPIYLPTTSRRALHIKGAQVESLKQDISEEEEKIGKLSLLNKLSFSSMKEVEFFYRQIAQLKKIISKEQTEIEQLKKVMAQKKEQITQIDDLDESKELKEDRELLELKMKKVILLEQELNLKKLLINYESLKPKVKTYRTLIRILEYKKRKLIEQIPRPLENEEDFNQIIDLLIEELNEIFKLDSLEEIKEKSDDFILYFEKIIKSYIEGNIDTSLMDKLKQKSNLLLCPLAI